MLGLRKRSKSGLVSSAFVTGDPGLELEEDGGRAKSVEEVGRDGRSGFSDI